MKPLKRSPRILFMVALACASAMITSGSAAQENTKPASAAPPSVTTPAVAPEGDYVGTEVCVTCHADQEKSFVHTIMGNAMAHAKTPEEKLGCEACHGPGKAHVEAGGGKDTIPVRFTKDSTTPVEERNAACLSCHTKGNQMFWSGSPHESRAMACVDCHNVHYGSPAERYRAPGGATPTPLDCGTPGRGCDSANNDWGSTSRDFVHIFAVGFDVHFNKKANVNTYYSLSAAKGNVDSRPFGDPTLLTGPDKFLLTGTNAAVDYPETVSRNHQVVATFRYKLTKNVTSKVEYRYLQFDSKDYQTSAMTPYMGCVSPIAPGAPVPGCTSPQLDTPSPFYPYFVVGDTSAARYLFLGADQPSYRAHYLAATIHRRQFVIAHFLHVWRGEVLQAKLFSHRRLAFAVRAVTGGAFRLVVAPSVGGCGCAPKSGAGCQNRHQHTAKQSEFLRLPSLSSS